MSKNGPCVTSLPEQLTASSARFRALSRFAMATNIFWDGSCSFNPDPVLGNVRQAGPHADPW